MPPLWKIKDIPFWFIGTLHFLKQEDYPIPSTLQETINIAELLVLEDKDFLIKGQSCGIYEKGKNISSELSTEAVTLLLNKCGELGLSFEIIQTFRPWKAALVVAAALWKSIGFSPEYGFDKYLLVTFSSSKKQIASLEDSLEVLQFFEHLTRNDQEMMLVEHLKNTELLNEQVQNLREAWKLGSEELFIKFCHEPLRKIPGLFQQFIPDRNARWTPKIKELIDNKSPTLVAVGSAHLFGESNVIDALINLGYNIERLA